MIDDYYLVRGREMSAAGADRRGGEYEYRRGFNPKAIIAVEPA